MSSMVYVSQAGGWKLTNITAKLLGNDDETDLKVADDPVDVPDRFSYSCNRLVLKPVNASLAHYTLALHHFQVQPFYLGNSTKFSESYDCEPFFTIPIFMGIFVGCFLTSILAVGVYMLFNIKTPDRFDDPKSRLLSLAPTE